MDQLQWEDPPERAITPRMLSLQQKGYAAQLKQRPGEWGVVNVKKTKGTAAVVASDIRLAKTRTWEPKGAYEAVVAQVDGEWKVYARYVGIPDTPVVTLKRLS